MSTSSGNTLLAVDSMFVDFAGPHGSHSRILEDISFSMGRRTSLVVLGESGSGKTILSRALTKLFARDREPVVGGTVVFEGLNLLAGDASQLQDVRRRDIRYVFQDPMQALNPTATVGRQMKYAAVERPGVQDSPPAVLQAVDLDPDNLRMFPHQLSVGMAQRVAIAMAVIASPKLIVADEPTSSLDVTLRHQVMEVLAGLCATRGVSLLLITHDLRIAQRFGDDVVVLHRGQIVEKAPVRDFFSRPYHPYSRLVQQLHASTGQATVSGPRDQEENLSTTSAGCRFAGQCPLVRDRCRIEEPTLEHVGPGREVRCFYWN